MDNTTPQDTLDPSTISSTPSASGEMIIYPFGQRTSEGYLALPVGDGPHPGLIVIHEIFGLNDNIKEVTGRLANEGYAALAVDLFARRNRTACMLRFMSYMVFSPLKNQAQNELQAALTYLSQRPEVDAQRIGAIGFCMGGGFAIAWACTDPRLKVIAPFYGVNPRPLSAIQRACPVVGSYPENDFTAGQARKLDAALTQYAIPHDIKIYPGARHSFFNDRGRSYNPTASADAWSRTLAYFAEKLSQLPSTS